jgi:hypothetical protein
MGLAGPLDPASGWYLETTPLLGVPSVNEFNGEVSPDGHWLAYQSDESSQDEIYVRPFPGPTRRSHGEGWEAGHDTYAGYSVLSH